MSVRPHEAPVGRLAQSLETDPHAGLPDASKGKG